MLRRLLQRPDLSCDLPSGPEEGVDQMVAGLGQHANRRAGSLRRVLDGRVQVVGVTGPCEYAL